MPLITCGPIVPLPAVDATLAATCRKGERIIVWRSGFIPHQTARTHARSAWLAALLWLCAAAGLAGTPDDTGAAAASEALSRWLAETGLAEDFQLVRIRYARDPRRPFSGERIHRVELRWVGPGADRDDAAAFVTALSGRYEAERGVPLLHALFLKSKHLLGVPGPALLTHVHALDVDISTGMNESGEITVDQSEPRFVTRNTDIEMPAVPLPDLAVDRATLPSTEPPDPAILRALVAGFFHPDEIRWTDVNPRYLGFVVRTRGRIVEDQRFWEDIQGSMMLDPGESVWRLRCFLDARYAAGLGANRPAADSFTDMEPGYTRQLQDFAGTLLVHIEDGLTP